MNEVESLYRKISTYLQAVRSRANTLAALKGALSVTAFVLILACAAVLVEGVTRLSSPVRTLIVWTVLGTSVAGLAVLAGLPLLRLVGILRDEGDLATATRVGGVFPGVRDRLLNLLQLYEERNARVPVYSTELIDAAFDDLRPELEVLTVPAVVSFASLRGRAKLAGGATLLCALLGVLFPGAATRLLHYDRAYAEMPALQLMVEPGNVSVVKGQSVDITVHALGEAPPTVEFYSRPEGQRDFEKRTLEPSEPQKFEFRLRALGVSTEYFVQALVARSDTFRIAVTPRPLVRTLNLTLQYPRYSRLGTRRLEDDVGDVTALCGTMITVHMLTSKPVSGAALLFSDSTRLPLRVEGSQAAGTFKLAKSLTYTISLLDSAGVRNSDPITYTLTVVPDAYPAAVILRPGTDLDVTETSSLDMLVKISDDFGFSRLRLAYRLVHSRYERPDSDFTYRDIPMGSSPGAEALVSYRWPLAELSLVPEDAVQYYVEVFDNDDVSGPKSSVSETFLLRLPSLDEVFADVDRAHEQGKENLEASLEAAREARKDLEELKQEVLKDAQKLDWQTQRHAENVLKDYAEIQKKLDAVQQGMAAMTEEMRKHQLLSPQTLEKYQELQRVMEQLNSPEFAEAMKRMQQALQQLNPEALRKALQNMEFSEEAFRQSIERTLALVKRIQIEQRMEELVRRAEGMEKAQETVRDQTAEAARKKPQASEELSRRQAGLEQERAGIDSSLNDLATKMEEFASEMPVQELDKAREAISREGLQEDLEHATESLQRGEYQEAGPLQSSALQKMKNFQQRMGEARQALQRNQLQQVVTELGGVLRDLLELSERQENLMAQSGSVDQNSASLRENAQQQMDLQRDLVGVAGRLGKLGQKTFSVSPEMGKSVGDALRSMSESIKLLDERAGGTASGKQRSAMASLNEAAEQVEGALNALREGGGQGMGMAGLLQRLQRLTGMQQGINDATRGLTPQQAAEMARLAGEQGMVRKSLEQLAREAALAGETSRLLGDLNRVAQEMREVQTDLAQNNVNPETLRRQERILSRLLDSQRSLAERDFEKRRKAETGRTLARTRPAPLDLSSEELKNKLRQDLLKALEGGYAPEYEELIRKYFEILEQQ